MNRDEFVESHGPEATGKTVELNADDEISVANDILAFRTDHSTDDSSTDGGFSRRRVLQTFGTGAGLSALSGIGQARIGGGSAKRSHGHGFPPANTGWGESAAVGNGEIQTFVTTHGNKPTFVGVYFTAEMLTGLPDAPTDGKYKSPGKTAPCCGHEQVLDFPASIRTTDYKWFMLNWNPIGHPPPKVYAVPHFDFHFYTMRETKRSEIENAETLNEVCTVNKNGTVAGNDLIDQDGTFDADDARHVTAVPYEGFRSFPPTSGCRKRTPPSAQLSQGWATT